MQLILQTKEFACGKIGVKSMLHNPEGLPAILTILGTFESGHTNTMLPVRLSLADDFSEVFAPD